MAAVAIIFGQLFGRDFGLVNWLLDLFGVGDDRLAGRPAASQIAIAVMVVWRWTGYNALIYLAAMQAVPKDLYEAAALDGATGQQFRPITVPTIRPTIIFTVIISTIGGLQVFAEPLLFGSGTNASGGGPAVPDPARSTCTRSASRRFDFGYASAVAWVMFVLILIVAAVNFLITRRLGGVMTRAPAPARAAGHAARRSRGSGPSAEPADLPGADRRRRRSRSSRSTGRSSSPAATNDALGQVPPPVLPGGNLVENIERMFGTPTRLR